MDVACLCSEVAKYDVLYNPLNSHFKNPQRKEMAWRLVAENLGTDWFVCRDKFKKLRDAFVRSMRKRKSEGTGGKYKFEKELEFLVPYIKHRMNELIPPDGTVYDSDVESEDPPSLVSIIRRHSPPTAGGTPPEVDADSSVDGIPATVSSSPLSNNHLLSMLSTAPSATKNTVSTATSNGQPENKRARVDDINKETPSSGRYQQRASPEISPLSYAAMFQEDESGVFGRLVACSLRRLCRRSQIITRKKIFEILIESETENYNTVAYAGLYSNGW